MLRFAAVLAGTLIPMLGMACESADRRSCMNQFRQLVSYRMEAIEGAFGDFFGVMPDEIKLRFVGTKDLEYGRLEREAYDQQRRTLVFPRRALSAKTPNPLRWASYYWPYYQDERHREEFPIVGQIDNLLWNVFLQEAARVRGHSWPHKECVSSDVGKRLPCEMVIKGVAEHVKTLRSPLFNVNRLDRIWPEDFAEFEKRVWRRSNQEYLDVQRYGGIMLAEPLVSEFGVLATIAYMAQTPFLLEDNNLRLSAERYQQRAREALSLAPRAPLNSGGRLSVQASPEDPRQTGSSERPRLETISH